MRNCPKSGQQHSSIQDASVAKAYEMSCMVSAPRQPLRLILHRNMKAAGYERSADQLWITDQHTCLHPQLGAFMSLILGSRVARIATTYTRCFCSHFPGVDNRPLLTCAIMLIKVARDNQYISCVAPRTIDRGRTQTIHLGMSI